MSYHFKAQSLWLASLLMSVAFFVHATRSVQTTGCSGCVRHGKVGEVTSPEWTPTEKDREEISAILLPGAKLQPGAKVPYISRDTIWPRLTERLTTDCFYMRHYRDTALAEYVFTADLSRTGPGDGDWRLMLNLYYDGLPREMVGTWTTTGSPGGCLGRMFKYSDAVMRRIQPIELILWDFERRPVKCVIGPEKKDIPCGERMPVILAGFQDEKGRPAKSFNRILVKAEKGQILDGERCETDPAAKVFLVGDGMITVQYQAPAQVAGADDKDTINVSNSCEIARPDLLPLAKTKAVKKIGECPVELRCGAAPGTIFYQRHSSWEDTATNKAGTVTYKGRVAEEVTFRVRLKYANSDEDDDYYEIQAATASYSLKYHNDTIINGKKGLPETVEDSGTIDEDAIGVLLVINRKAKTYTLDCTCASPTRKEGQWRIAIQTSGLLKGSTDGRAVKGFYASSRRSSFPVLSTNDGDCPGTSWSWNLEITPQKR